MWICFYLSRLIISNNDLNGDYLKNKGALVARSAWTVDGGIIFNICNPTSGTAAGFLVLRPAGYAYGNKIELYDANWVNVWSVKD